MKKAGLVLVLFFTFILVGCARTRVSDIFRFESREIEIKIGEEKNIGLIVGDLDSDAVIVYSMESETFGYGGELVVASTIVEMNGSDSTYFYRDTITGNRDLMTLKGLSSGVVRLTAYLQDSPNISDTIRITVAGEKLGGFQILPTDSTMLVGRTMALEIVTFPAGIDADIVYSSSDENVLTVSSNGVVTAVGVGVATINAASQYDDKIVGQKQISVTYPLTSGIVLKDTSISLYVGDTYDIAPVAISFEENATASPNFRYNVGSSNVVRIDSNGLLTAVNAGTVTVSVENIAYNLQGNIESLYTERFQVTVSYRDETSLSISTEDVTVEKGRNVEVPYTVGPIEADQELVVEILSGADVVSAVSRPFNRTGTTTESTLQITGVDVGEASIRVATKNGNYSAVINVKVNYATPTSIVVRPANNTITVGETLELTATIYPTAGASQSAIFTSSDAAVATVDASGVVTGLSEGTVTITATDENGLVTAQATVEVTAPITD